MQISSLAYSKFRYIYCDQCLRDPSLANGEAMALAEPQLREVPVQHGDVKYFMPWWATDS